MLNYEILTQPTHEVNTLAVNGVVYGSTGVDYAIDDTEPKAINVFMRERPDNTSNVVAKLPENTQVIMHKEWVTGDDTWSYVKLSAPLPQSDPGQNVREGYVLTKFLIPYVHWTYGNLRRVLPKAIVDTSPMSELEKVLLPTWYELDKPFFHRENGEWWVPVTLPYTCIESGTLEQKKADAKLEAVKVMYEYFSADLPGVSNITTQEEFVNGWLSCVVPDFFLPTRPSAKLRMLAIIPAVYLQYLRNQVQQHLKEDTIQIGDDELCVTILLDQIGSYEQNTKQCLKKYYQDYLNSNIKVKSFNFETEIKKQLDSFKKIKTLLDDNLLFLPTQTSDELSTVCETGKEAVKLCFGPDYRLKSVLYVAVDGKERLLTTGLSNLKNSHPFNDPRFGYLFVNQIDICSQQPSLKQFFDEYVIDPKPEITTVNYKIDTPGQFKKVSGFGEKELGVVVGTVAVLQAMANSFDDFFGYGNDNFESKNVSKKDLDKWCQDPEFIKKAAELRDLQTVNTGDKLTLAEYICNLDPGLPDLGELPRIDDLPGPSFPGLGRFPKLPDFGLGIGRVDDLKKFWGLPRLGFGRFVIERWCELLVAGTLYGATFAAALAYVFRDYLFPQNNNDQVSPVVLAKSDFGGKDVNIMLQDSIGVYDEEIYEDNLVLIFDNCGIPKGSVDKGVIHEYLKSISSIVSPLELLNLLDGTATKALLNEVYQYTKENNNEIHFYKDNISKLTDFFLCLGENISSNVIDQVEQEITTQYENPEVCQNIKKQLEEIIKEKCPDPQVYTAIYEKEFNEKTETFKNVINLFENPCDLNSPSIFNIDGKKGVLSSKTNKPKNQDFILERLAETLIGPIKVFMESDTKQYYNSTFGQKFKDLVGENTGEGLLLDNDLVLHQSNGEATVDGTAYEYKLNYPDSGRPLYTLKPDGTETIEQITNSPDSSVIISKSAYNVSEFVQNILDDGTINNLAKQAGASKHQQVFYQLMQYYFTNNSNDNENNPFSYSGENFPMPYGVIDYVDPDNYKDGMFGLIFSQFIERIARKVGFSWTGSDQELSGYSLALSNNALDIIEYDELKKGFGSHYSVVDQEEYGDQAPIGAKQYSMMNGLLTAYFRIYILDYLAKGTPYYEKFYYPKNYYNFNEVSNQVIKNTIIKDLQSKNSYAQYNGFFNQVYDFISTRGEAELQSFEGQDRGIEYYIATNYNNVDKLFGEYLNSVPSEIKKTKESSTNGVIIYSKSKALAVHEYAGLGLIPQVLGSRGVKVSEVQDVSNKAYSLFGDRYKYFKNGMFFIQRYMYTEDKNALFLNEFLDRDSDLRGVVSHSVLTEKIDKLITDAGQEDALMKELYKKGKIYLQDRLCFGIAHDFSDDSVDPEIRDFVQSMYKNYATLGKGINEGTVFENSNYIKQSWAASMNHKYLICLDGPNSVFKNSSGQTTPSDFPIEPDGYLDYEGTFSVVIPIITGGKFTTVTEDGENQNETWKDWVSPYKNNSSYSKSINPDTSTFLRDTLIESDKYKALTELSFSTKNMIHFNAFSGIAYYANTQSISPAFQKSRDVIFANMAAIANSKKYNYIGE
jgi:hypothetical protein